MGKKKKAAAGGVTAEQQQQQQQQQRAQQQRAAAAASQSSDSDSDSPSPVAVAPAKSKKSGAAAMASSSSSSSAKRSRVQPLPSSLPPAFGDTDTPDPRAFTLVTDRRSPDWPAVVPDRAYLSPTLPQGSWARVWRNLYWKWRLHSVAQMFDPVEIVILNVGAVVIGTAATAYVASTVAGMLL